MSEITTFLGNPYTQAMFWTLCVIFAWYFSYAVKKLSFGEDTGTKAWSIIAIALFIIGVRVSFKVIFPTYGSSYILQMSRFTLGIIGVIVLYFGFKSLYASLRRMYGSED